jgi:hypothetical protein
VKIHYERVILSLISMSYHIHCFDTSAGGLLVSAGNIQPVVSVTITVSIPLLVDY